MTKITDDFVGTETLAVTKSRIGSIADYYGYPPAGFSTWGSARTALNEVLEGADYAAIGNNEAASSFITKLNQANLASDIEIRTFLKANPTSGAWFDFVNDRYGAAGAEDDFDDLITFTRAGSKTGVLSSGLIGTFGTDVPAFVHDPVSLARRGLSVEGSRTNLALRSEDWTVSPWAAVSANVSNSTISGGNPSGGASALLIVPDAGAGDKFVGQELTSQDLSVERVLSVFLKAGGLTTFGVRLRNNAQTIGIQANFDLVAGTATASNFGGPISAITPIIEAYPNGWWRCTVGGALSGTTETLRIRIGQSATHNGTSGVYGWGAQLEPGTRPTSYIPTEATAVTRAADDATADATGWVAAGQGTLIAVGRRLRGAVATLVNLHGSDALIDRTVLNQQSDGRLTAQVLNDGTVQANLTNIGTAPAEGAPFAAAVSWNASRIAACLNGSAASAVSVGGYTFPAHGTLQIGRRTIGGNVWNGPISRALYYPTALSDAEIQAITAALAAGG